MSSFADETAEATENLSAMNVNKEGSVDPALTTSKEDAATSTPKSLESR